MFDLSSMGFFRPWNREFVFITTINDDNTAMNKETNDESTEKCVKRRDSDEEEEDTNSVDSSWSANSEVECYQLRGDLRRQRAGEYVSSRRTLESSCSAGSCDDPSTMESLYTCSNFKISGKSNEQNGRNKAKTSMTNDDDCHNSSSSSESSSEISSNDSPRSAFRPTSYGLVNPSLDYPAPMMLDTFMPNWQAGQSDQMNLFYGIAPIPIGPYGTCLEEAVKFIHHQDVAAKQMKKLRPKKFRCPHCKVAFSNNGQLKGHIRIHTGERPFKCESDGCNKAFTRNEELTRHRKIHTGLKPHACEMCGKSFGRKDHLKKHQRTHENRGISGHFNATMFGYIEHGHGHYQALSSGCPVPPYHYPV